MNIMMLEDLEFQLPQGDEKISAAAGGGRAHGLRQMPSTVRIPPKRRTRRSVGRRLGALIARAIRPARTLADRFSCVLAEYRVHRAAIVLELTRARCRLSTHRNDDFPPGRNDVRNKRAAG